MQRFKERKREREIIQLFYSLKNTKINNFKNYTKLQHVKHAYKVLDH